MRHLAPLVPVGLNQPQVDVAFTVLDDRMPFNVHTGHPSLVGPTLPHPRQAYMHVIRGVLPGASATILALHESGRHRRRARPCRGHQKPNIPVAKVFPLTATHSSTTEDQDLHPITAVSGAGG